MILLYIYSHGHSSLLITPYPYLLSFIYFLVPLGKNTRFKKQLKVFRDIQTRSPNIRLSVFPSLRAKLRPAPRLAGASRLGTHSLPSVTAASCPSSPPGPRPGGPCLTSDLPQFPSRSVKPGFTCMFVVGGSSFVNTLHLKCVLKEQVKTSSVFSPV